MDRRLVQGLIALSLVGCARDRTVLPKPGAYVPPTATAPLPKIGQAVNNSESMTDSQVTRSGPTVSESTDAATVTRKANATPPAKPVTLPPPTPITPLALQRPIKPEAQGAPTNAAAPDAAAASRPAATFAAAPALAAPPQVEAALQGDDSSGAPPRLAEPSGASAAQAGPAASPEAQPGLTAAPEPPARVAPKDDAVSRTALDDDPARKTGADEASVRSNMSPGQLLNLNVATVGGEPISKRDLDRAYREWHRLHVPPGQRVSRQDFEEINDWLLDDLINRSVVVQEAKRSFLKSEKAQKGFNEFADKRWEEKELPVLLRKYKAKDRRELDELLKAEGRSVKEIMELYRLETLKNEFVVGRLQSKLKPSVTEVRQHYERNLSKYDRRAQVTWREIVIKAPTAADRPAARRKAEETLARLRKGAEFAATARSVSQGPTAHKGGLRVTEPRASSTPAVNDALDRLPLKEISPLLEGRDGYHIVRVDARRPAGPAPFLEVQEAVQKDLCEDIFQREVGAYLEKLRSQTVVKKIVSNVRSQTRPRNRPQAPPPEEPSAGRGSG